MSSRSAVSLASACLRPMPWELFYDADGRNVLKLVRKLARLRSEHAQFQTGDYYFYNDWNLYQSRGLVLFSRSASGRFSLVALNFTDDEVEVPFVFPQGGNYRELLHAEHDFTLAAAGQQWLKVPSHYGRIWTV